MNPTNGVFHWTPTCDQATTINTITVWVTDSGQTSLMDAVSFTVVVRECGQPTLGLEVTEAGLALTWPVTASGFALEQTEDLTPPAQWMRVPETPNVVGNQFRLPIAPTNATVFYRLVR